MRVLAFCRPACIRNVSKRLSHGFVKLRCGDDEHEFAANRVFTRLIQGSVRSQVVHAGPVEDREPPKLLKSLKVILNPEPLT